MKNPQRHEALGVNSQLEAYRVRLPTGEAGQASMRLYFILCGVSSPTRFLWSASYSV